MSERFWALGMVAAGDGLVLLGDVLDGAPVVPPVAGGVVVVGIVGGVFDARSRIV